MKLVNLLIMVSGTAQFLEGNKMPYFPSLANHWGDLHVLLDAVPRFPSGVVNPLPLLALPDACVDGVKKVCPVLIAFGQLGEFFPQELAFVVAHHPFEGWVYILNHMVITCDFYGLMTVV